VYAHPQQETNYDVRELRRAAGRWLKSLREQRGLSQRQLAEKVGVEYYTFISQLEAGRGRVPPERYETWAAALGVEPKWFVKGLMQFYDPITHRILFGDTDADTAGQG